LTLLLTAVFGYSQSNTGTYSKDVFGNTQYQDNNGTKGTYSKDVFGNTQY